MNNTINPATTAQRYPSHDEIVRQRLMDAAIQCVQQNGIEKVNMRNIAECAGFARQTLYKYYGNKYDILADAFMREGLAFADGLAGHIQQFPAIPDQFVEAFLYAVETLPQNPVLLLLVKPGEGFISHLGTSYHPFSLFGDLAFRHIFDANPGLRARSEDIAEYWGRNALSFMILQGTRDRSRAEMEAYVRFYLLPGLHLHDAVKPD